MSVLNSSLNVVSAGGANQAGGAFKVQRLEDAGYLLGLDRSQRQVVENHRFLILQLTQHGHACRRPDGLQAVERRNARARLLEIQPGPGQDHALRGRSDREAKAQALRRDPRVPRRRKLLLLAVVGYLALPLDLVPDFIPVVGQLDDAIVVAFVLRSFVRSSGEELIRELWPGPPQSLELILRLAVGRT